MLLVNPKACEHSGVRRRGLCPKCYRTWRWLNVEKPRLNRKSRRIPLPDPAPCPHEHKFCRNQCSACYARWRRKNSPAPAKVRRNWELKRRYGLTIADYERMIVEQGGKCALCKRPPKTQKLNVDHNHKTGKVRKLLCSLCNRYVIGVIEQRNINPQDIVEYLR
jgi:hypothetical protein